MNPFLLSTQEGIVDEATKTKPASMTMREAIATLIEDRVERGILSDSEALVLHDLNKPLTLEKATCTTCGAAVGTLIPHIGPRHLDGIPYPFMYHTPTKS